MIATVLSHMLSFLAQQQSHGGPTMDVAAVLANIDKRRKGAEFFERAERIEGILLDLAELQEDELAEKLRQLATLYGEVAGAWSDHSLVRGANEVHQPAKGVTPPSFAAQKQSTLLAVPASKPEGYTGDVAYEPPPDPTLWAHPPLESMGPVDGPVDAEPQATEADWQAIADLPPVKNKPGWPKGKPRKLAD